MDTIYWVFFAAIILFLVGPVSFLLLTSTHKAHVPLTPTNFIWKSIIPTEPFFITRIMLTASFTIKQLFADNSPIPETSEKVTKITTETELDALLSSTTNVLVDFYADWCPPCRAIAPVFSKLADEHASKGKLAFAKVNVDKVNNVSQRYSISAMPTFVVFQNGKPKGLAIQSLKNHQSIVFSDDGLVERIRGANKPALDAVVGAMASL